MSFGDTWDVLQLPIKAKISRIQVEWPDRPLYWVGLSAMQIQNIGAQLVRWRDNKVRRIIYSDYGEIKLAYREDTITTRVYSQTSISEEVLHLCTGLTCIQVR